MFAPLAESRSTPPGDSFQVSSASARKTGAFMTSNRKKSPLLVTSMAPRFFGWRMGMG